MVIVRTAAGECDFLLQNDRYGLRLVNRHASYDLAAMVSEAGWRIIDADANDRLLLEGAGVGIPRHTPASFSVVQRNV
jgi:hypothetical protein